LKNQNKHIVIAIDGLSSCGKSTLAKLLSEKLNYLYVDSGAMYRCITLLMLEQDIEIDELEKVSELLFNTKIYFKQIDKVQRTYINGRDVTDEIRFPRISDYVSEVSTISSVRKKLVEQQRQYLEENNLVMDGRDIGTVVFPHAQLKIFLTASPEIRAHRRYAELQDKGVEIDYESVLANLMKRDRIDSSRFDSPLKKATDAIELDNTEMSIDDMVNQVISLLSKINTSQF